MKILFISLGCDKNLVDSEHMLGLLVKHGYEITDDETRRILSLSIPAVLFMTPKKRALRIFFRWRNTKNREAAKCFL